MRDGERLNITSKGIMDRLSKNSFFEGLQDQFMNDSTLLPIQGHEVLFNLAIFHTICAYKSILYHPFG